MSGLFEQRKDIARAENIGSSNQLTGIPMVHPTELSVMDIPQIQRQRIVVIPDDVAEQIHSHLRDANALNDSVWKKIKKQGNVQAAGILRAMVRMRAKNSNVFVISLSEAAAFDFEPGHPMLNTVYVVHPLLTHQYFDAAHFHERLIEGKFAELLRILIALGATTIEIEQVQGKRSDNLLETAFGRFGISAEARRQRKKFSRSHIIWSSTLPGHNKPRLPDGELAWFETEPMWQLIAESRTEFRQKEFKLLLRHDSSIGVTRQLKIAIKAADLDAGGDLQEQEVVAWDISGRFQ